MVSQPTAFLTESGLEAADVAAGLQQVAVTHQPHQVHLDPIYAHFLHLSYMTSFSLFCVATQHAACRS